MPVESQLATDAYWSTPLLEQLRSAESETVVESWEDYCSAVGSRSFGPKAENALTEAISKEDDKIQRAKLLLERAEVYLASEAKFQRALGDLSDVCRDGDAEDQCEAWLLKAYWARQKGDLRTLKSALSQARRLARTNAAGGFDTRSSADKQVKLDGRDRSVPASVPMDRIKPFSRLADTPDGGAGDVEASAVAEALVVLEKQAEILTDEEVARLTHAFQKAVSGKHERLVFGDSPKTRRSANRFLRSMVSREDLTDSERRELVEALRHVCDKYDWQIYYEDEDTGNRVRCRVSIGPMSHSGGNRIVVRTIGAKARYISKAQTLPRLTVQEP